MRMIRTHAVTEIKERWWRPQACHHSEYAIFHRAVTCVSKLDSGIGGGGEPPGERTGQLLLTLVIH